MRVLLPTACAVVASLLSSCVLPPKEEIEDQGPSPVELGLAQCLDIQQAQAQSISALGEQLGQQLGSLSDSVDTVSQQLGEQNQAADNLVLSCPTFEEMPEKMLVGQQEVVWLQDIQLALPARVDTGAETASIDARDIESFERDGNTWVRFNILHPETGDPLMLERVLKRRVSIVQSNTVEAERRPVIELGITIGSIRQTAEFTLSDRSHLNHQILIGRNILQDVMIVDVSEQNIAPYERPEPLLSVEMAD